MPDDTVLEQTADRGLLQHLTPGGPRVTDPPRLPDLGGRLDPRAPGRVAELVRVNQQIAAVLARVPLVPGAEVTFEAVGEGWRQAYEGLDVYVGPAGGFEVHGDIREKYHRLGGPTGVLGWPATDETGTPDGVGRYNHFQGGSIYWTPHTGPMMVRGPIRDRWAALGWERSWLGYPVADEVRLAPFGPQDHPKVAWSRFENGAIGENVMTVDVAPAVDIPNPDLRRLVRRMVDAQAHAADDTIGFGPQTDDLGTSGWGWDLYSSVRREVGLRLYGFRKNPVVDDTDFTVELKLRFVLVWTPTFTYPTTVSLAASLGWIKVHAGGFGHGAVAEGVKDGLWKAFWRGGPDPAHPEVPDGAVFVTTVDTGADQRGDGNLDVIDVMTTAAGGLQVLVAPGPIIPGGTDDGRRVFAQAKVDALLDG